MFKSKVYTVSVSSSGIVLEEERIAREVINRWSLENGEKTGVVLLPLLSGCEDVIPDIYIFAIDNYVEAGKVEAAIATGAKVFLFFCKHHDPNNTLQTELDKIASFRIAVQSRCTCVDYDETTGFGEALKAELDDLCQKNQPMVKVRSGSVYGLR